MSKFLVLGSEGIVGSAFCDLLLSKGISFIRWDVKLSPSHDLADEGVASKLEETMRDTEYILFAAYDVGGAKYLTSSNTTIINNNMRIMSNVFRCLEKVRGKKFIFCSSTMAHISDNWYGVSKRLGELYTKALGGISVRLWNIYGFESPSGKSHVITDYVHMALNNGTIKMMTNGEEKRQMLHNSDCAEALLTIFNNYNQFKDRETVDIGSGEWVTIIHIANLIKELIPGTTVIPGETSDKFHTTYMEPSIDWKPKISLREGILGIINKVNSEGRGPPLAQASKKVHLGEYSLETVSKLLNTTVTGNGDSDKHLLTLFSIALQVNAKNILELGVRNGATTLPLLAAAKITGGKVTSVDIDRTDFVCPSELSSHWEFIHGDSITFLENTSNQLKKDPKKPWDLVFIDDWHAYEHVKKELSLLDFQISPSSVILLHDLMYADYQPHYHSDIALEEGQWAKGGPYRAVAELNPNFWEFSTIPVNNGLTILRKKYSRLAFPK